MSDAASPDVPTFEQCLAELERIVNGLEDGGIGLEESLALYEKGVGLLKQCYGQLRQAEQRIQVLIGLDENNQPQTEDFQHQASAPEKRTGRRRQSRSSSDELPI